MNQLLVVFAVLMHCIMSMPTADQENPGASNAGDMNADEHHYRGKSDKTKLSTIRLTEFFFQDGDGVDIIAPITEVTTVTHITTPTMEATTGAEYLD